MLLNFRNRTPKRTDRTTIELLDIHLSRETSTAGHRLPPKFSTTIGLVLPSSSDFPRPSPDRRSSILSMLYTYKSSSRTTLSIKIEPHQNPLCSFKDLSIHRDRQREATLFYTMLWLIQRDCRSIRAVTIKESQVHWVITYLALWELNWCFSSSHITNRIRTTQMLIFLVS
jgi:hypothetical protein